MREVSAALPGPANGTFREECSDTFADFAALVHFVFPMTRGRWFDFAVTNDFVDHRLAGHLRERRTIDDGGNELIDASL